MDKDLEMKNRIINYINENKNWLIDKTCELISANTVNTPPNGNENNGQDIIENIFNEMGLEIDRFSPDEVNGFKKSKYYLKGRNYKKRDNLVGSIGKGDGKKLIFNGHMDTVPTKISKWTKTKPFKPKLIGEKLYGLGSCDMKGGLASFLMALKSIIDLGLSIKGKVFIESVVDEEFGGANGSLACVKKGYVGDFAVIAEPTNMQINVSNLSSMVMEIRITTEDKGLFYTKKSDKGLNPLILGARVINALKEYESFLNSLKDKYEIYKEIDKPIRFLFSDIKAGEIGPDKIITTPEECLIRIYMMNYPDIDKNEFNNMIISFMKRYPDIYKNIENGSINIINRSRFIEGGDFDLKSGTNRKFIKRIINNGKELANIELNTGATLGGTDFFAFSNFGNMPVVILGPGGGNCHAPDEFVNMNDLINLSKIYAGLIYDYCC